MAETVNPLSFEAFAAWCETKPAEETYNYEDRDACACAQYARHLGVPFNLFTAGPDRDAWFELDLHALFVSTAPRSFGNLAKALRYASTNPQVQP